MGIAALLAFIRTLELGLPLSIVAAWSAAEAALFFLVADMPISWIAVRSGTKAAVLAAVAAALASVLGAGAVLVWAGRDAAGAAAAMAALPAIDPALVAEAAERFHRGFAAMLAGAFGGVPFKLFALAAARDGGVGLLLATPLLRLPRFLLVALLAGGVSAILERWMTRRRRLMLLAALWAVFYAGYFALMPG